MIKNKKPIKKAWAINWDEIDEGYYYSGNIDVVYAETRSKARGKFFSDTDICDYKLYGGDDIEFINIPFKRCKGADKYNIDGEVLTEWQYEEKQTEIKRQNILDNILNDSNISHCYIKKGSYYQDNWAGYTDFKSRAGVYIKKEAISHARNVREIDIIPINKEDHNTIISLEIDKLKKRLIL